MIQALESAKQFSKPETATASKSAGSTFPTDLASKPSSNILIYIYDGEKYSKASCTIKL